MSKTSKGVILVPSRKSIRELNSINDGEQTEIVAHLSIPKEGGWAWVIVCGAFANLMILDGTCFTFGSLINNMAAELNASLASVSLINSIAVAMYFLSGPFVSSLCNRFGFRACTMLGSCICTFSYFLSFWGQSILYLCVFQGFFGGLGFALINISSGLVVGFNFEKLRALATGISSIGSCVGVMVFSVLMKKLVMIDGWRTVVLIQSAILGIAFFFAMTYSPLHSITVRKTDRNKATCKTVTFLPAISQKSVVMKKSQLDRTKEDSQTILMPTTAERVFGTAANENYPISSDVVSTPKGNIEILKVPIPKPAGGYEITTYGEEVSRIHINDMRNIKSAIPSQGQDAVQEDTKVQQDTERKKLQEIKKNITKDSKKRWWKRIFHWQPEIEESRPLYRDDAFFHADIQKLPEYEKSCRNLKEGNETGVEYTLEVTRAAAIEDLEEKRGVFTTAMRRVLATMLDLSLLKKHSFIFYSIGGMLFYFGYSVPYVFLPTWTETEGVESRHADLFVSTIAFANIVGKLLVGGLASKINSIVISSLTQLLCGVSLCITGVSFSIPFQYFNCCMFGIFVSGITTLRCITLVELYGLEKLTNATGLILFFQGFGSLVGTPIAGILITRINYNAGFLFAGISIICSSFMTIACQFSAKLEKSKQNL